jgi:hypothetical protein
MKNHPITRHPEDRTRTLAIKSVMPGSVIAPGLPYSVPLLSARGGRDAVRRLEIDLHRHDLRHVMSGQRI